MDHGMFQRAHLILQAIKIKTGKFLATRNLNTSATRASPFVFKEPLSIMFFSY
jgi:hypothetical protein